MKERRAASRIKYKSEMILFRGAKALRGKICDLSLKGVSVHISDGKVSGLGKKIPFAINLCSPSKKISIRGIVEAARIDRTGKKLGLFFVSLKGQGLETLRSIVGLNFGDMDKIGKELRSLIKR